MSEQPVIIKTPAPIGLTDLKRKFTENVEFHIDYSASKLKGKVLINYLSNLNIECKLILTEKDDILSLLQDYLNHTSVVKIKDLEDLAFSLILANIGLPNGFGFDIREFSEANHEIIDVWVSRLAMAPVFAMYCHPKLKEQAMQYPQDPNDSLVGINFVNLFDHELFSMFATLLDEEDYSWNQTLFDEYMFAGKNFFHYFTSKNNPFFMAVLAIEAQTNLQPLLDTVTEIKQKLITHSEEA